MSYVVLARKYRPQTFDDLVGQEHVSQTLLNALSANRMAHAYVFSGPRGVGKTTTARILAKCLNCKKGPTATPCGTCDACQTIQDANSTGDVLEIDGASNRGIEQIRELRESAKFTPRDSRYRIFIIDEAHQITKDAFGALLKTLEEPPAHVIFMMATTEAHKIPSPILSRCQRFSLRPVSLEDMFNHLKKICTKEKVKVEDAALHQIGRFVEGSLRDALSLLDQAIVFAPKGITSDTLRDLLGLLPEEVIHEFAKTIDAGDPETILKHINRAIQNGVDITQLGKDLQNYYHAVLLYKAGVNDGSQLNQDSLKEIAANTPYEVLERSMRLLSQALDEMRRSETPRAVFEVYTLRMSKKSLDPRTLIARLESLEKKGFSPAPTPIQTRSVEAPPSTPLKKTPPKAENVGTAPVAVLEKPATGISLKAAWPAITQAVGQQKYALSSALEDAELQVSHDRAVITFTKAFHRDMVNQALTLISSVAAKHTSGSYQFETRLREAPAAPASAAPTPTAPSLSAPPRAVMDDSDGLEVLPTKEADEDIQNVMKHFPGTLKKEKS